MSKNESTAGPNDIITVPQTGTHIVFQSLPNEEVWLRIYCAALSSGIGVACVAANNGLQEFQQRFRY